jgi:hypothetical protein
MMNDLHTLYYYFGERGAYLLPMNVVLIAVLFLTLGGLVRSRIRGKEGRVFFYFGTASFISSMITYQTDFSGTQISVIEVPLFTMAGILVIYICYLPIKLALVGIKVIRKKTKQPKEI